MSHGLFYQCIYYVSGPGNISVVLRSMEGQNSPVPILDFWGPYAKLCRRWGEGGGGYEIMDETHSSVFHSVSNRVEKRSRNISSAARYTHAFFFFLMQETVRCSLYMI